MFPFDPVFTRLSQHLDKPDLPRGRVWDKCYSLLRNLILLPGGDAADLGSPGSLVPHRRTSITVSHSFKWDHFTGNHMAPASPWSCQSSWLNDSRWWRVWIYQVRISPPPHSQEYRNNVSKLEREVSDVALCNFFLILKLGHQIFVYLLTKNQHRILQVVSLSSGQLGLWRRNIKGSRCQCYPIPEVPMEKRVVKV